MEEKKVRLDKYISDYTELTRSQAKKAVRDGRVTVNGKTAAKGDEKVSFSDSVLLDQTEVKGAVYQYIMLNKPSGAVSATVDDGNITVVDLVRDGMDQVSGRPPSYVAKDLFPMGRLDKDTEGLLILTNDGALAHRLLSPGHHVPKKYYVELDAAVNVTDVEKMREGLDIGEKHLTKPAEMEILSENTCFLTITEGKFHQIKRMFRCLGKKVTGLKRVEMAGVELDETLAAGEWRFLTGEEVAHLKGI